MNRNVMTLIWISLCAVIICVFTVNLSHSGTAFGAEWSKWQGTKQASYYSGSGSASGIKTKNKMAVPISKVVSKKKWLKGSEKYKRTHFFYGERIQTKVVKGHYKGAVKTWTVVDCGNFIWAGGKYKGKFVHRWFDLHKSGIKNFLGTREGVCYVSWRYAK